MILTLHGCSLLYSHICSLLLNWRTKLRKYFAKKLKEEAKQLDQEIKYAVIFTTLRKITFYWNLSHRTNVKPFCFYSLSSDEEGNNSEAKSDKKNKKEEEKEDYEEEEMDKKLAELKAEEVADLKRLDSYVKLCLFSM